MTNRLVPLALAPIFLAGSAVVAAPVRVFIELTTRHRRSRARSATSTEGDRLAAAEITRPLTSRLRAEQMSSWPRCVRPAWSGTSCSVLTGCSTALR